MEPKENKIMKKTYEKPIISIIALKDEKSPVATTSAAGEDGLSISLEWLLG